LLVLGDRIFFGQRGELWASDGTEGGTVLVKKVSAVAELTAVGDRLFFSSGSRLWVSDGTEAGTVEVAAFSGLVVSVFNLAALRDRLFFFALDPEVLLELHVSDGTAAGTFVVKDIFPGPGYSFPGKLTVVGDLLFWAGDDGVHGSELWVSDGTEAGTVLVKDVYPGSSGSSPAYLTAFGARLLFWTFDDVQRLYVPWISDGTEAGTAPITRFSTDNPMSDPGPAIWLSEVGEQVFFAARDPEHGQEIWASDGTDDGTVLFCDVVQGTGGSDPKNLTAVGDLLFFTAESAHYGRELWVVPLREEEGGLQRPGDANQDGKLDLSDAIWLLGHLFLGSHPELPCEGGSASSPGPGALEVVDVNGDGGIDISDAVSALSFLFLGSKPPALGTECTRISGCDDRCAE
jgi:ELWxxDGT repeat protein